MKRLKANRLSHLAYGETFPTPNQKKIYAEFERKQNKSMSDKIPSSSGYLEPKISVDRTVNKIGLFDGFDLVRPFESYTNEAEAIKAANEWFKTRTIHVPQVIFPMITKMTMTSSRRKRS